MSGPNKDRGKGIKSKFGFNDWQSVPEKKEQECGWCGIRVARSVVLATPTCPTCAASRKVRIEQWHARMRRAAGVMLVVLVAACGDNQQGPVPPEPPPSKLFGEPCETVPGADITPCHSEQGACVQEQGDYVCRPWCTTDCEAIGGTEQSLPAGESGWLACVCAA